MHRSKQMVISIIRPWHESRKPNPLRVACPRSAARSGGSFVLDCANDRREYGTAGASGNRL
jgi:hypothetical protein